MKNRILRNFISGFLILSLIVCSYATAFASESIDNKQIQTDVELIKSIQSKIDINYGYELAKQVSLVKSGPLGFRTSGSIGEKEGAAIIEKAMKDLGLQNVRQDKFPVDSWNFGGGKLKITAPESKTLTLSSYAGSVGTPDEGITGEIVYVGNGTLAGYEGKDVVGKIVLAEFDMFNDYWVTQPSYQAELKGAKAIIVGYTGTSYGNRPDALNSFDVIARDTIPVMNISRQDAAYLKELLTKGSVTATLNSDVVLDKVNGESANVVGEIPGKMKDKYIILNAHYDGYFNAFQDDILGVGVFMSVAKAILKSGYQPEYTIVFVAQGSVEYGKTDNHYDWIIGSWYQNYVNSPEWSGNTIMDLNFDTQRPDMKVFNINVTPEYGQFFEKYALTMNLPEPWVDGYEILGTNGPWSDDYNYISNGIPGLIMGKGNSDWKYTSYHTNYDNYTIYNPVTFKFNVENYLAMVLNFDKMLVPPLNFAGLLEDSNNTLDSDLIKSAGLSDASLKQTANDFIKTTQEDYVNIQKANLLLSKIEQAEKLRAVTDMAAVDEFKADLLANSKIGLNAYKVIEKDFMKLDQWDVVVYGHQTAQTNLAAVMDVKAALENKDGAAALKAIKGAESGWMIPQFEKEVYEYWGIEAMNPERTDIFWGQGKTNPVIDLYDVYHAIDAKVKAGNTDFLQEIKTMDSKVVEAKATMSKCLTDEQKYLKQADEILNGYTLEAAIEKGNAILQSAYSNLSADYQYQDVNSDHWAYETIMDLELLGVLDNGGTFKPQEKATRAEIAKWLTEAFNLPTDVSKPDFSDVDKNSEDMGYIAAVVKAGFMNGVGGGKFMPDAIVTRAQMATIAANIMKLDTANVNATAFKDVSMSKWYGNSVAAASEAGLVIGTGSGNYEPDRAITKAETSAFVERMLYTK
jgi:Iap family predicted aminopeptidase